MIEDGYVVARMAAEQQAALMREMGAALRTPHAAGNARMIALRARTARLVAMAALALALLGGGLLNRAG